MYKIFTKVMSATVAFAFVATLIPTAAFAEEGLVPATETASSTPLVSNDSFIPLSDPAPSLAPAVIDTFSSTVMSETEFNAALSNSNITTIYIGADFTDAQTITISRAVTIEGDGHTITAGPTVTGQVFNVLANNVTINNLTLDGSNLNINGLNVYVAENVSLSHDTFKNNRKGGLIVNGSNVTADTISTSGNGYYGINVDLGGGVTHAANLTIVGVSTHSEGTKPAIYVDNTTKDVHVLGETSQYQVGTFGVAQAYYLTPACSTDTNSFDTFTIGSVNAQNGWTVTGPYDQAIAPNVYGFPTFGCKALRISNAVTSGAFGDQTFSYSTPNEAGETAAATSTLSGGTRQNHYEAQFDLASATSTQQAGLILSVSPDRGDGARMSFLRFEDNVSGIDVIFFDVQGASTSTASFVSTQVAGGTAATPALSRTAPHTIKFVVDLVDGINNDVVKIFIDGTLVHTGTTWENYFNFVEGNPTHAIDSLIFRAGGTASPTTQGAGYLFDNVVITTSTILPAVPVVEEETTTGNRTSGSRNTGGGGGGSTGGTTSTTAATTGTGTTGTVNSPAGQVLGASTFNVTRNFFFGLKGADVVELQTELIAAGYSIPAGPTGNYLTQTRAAIAAWQKDKGISPAVGYFGPISRAKYLADGGFGLPATPTSTTTTTSVTTQ